MYFGVDPRSVEDLIDKRELWVEWSQRDSTHKGLQMGDVDASRQVCQVY